METVRIGLVGEMRAGKDTVGELIKNSLKGYTFSFTFSSGIHEVIEGYMPELYLQGKPRLALQQIGQLFRSFKEDVWVDHLLNSEGFSGAYETGQNMIVTDVRQPNEVKRLKELGFTIVKVTAGKEVRSERIKASGDNFSEDMLQHETEILAASCKADITIDNSGTLDELESKVAALVETVKAYQVPEKGGPKDE